MIVAKLRYKKLPLKTFIPFATRRRLIFNRFLSIDLAKTDVILYNPKNNVNMNYYGLRKDRNMLYF